MLTSLILKLAVPAPGQELTSPERVRLGIASGMTGIACNVLLIIVKVILAVMTGSIAIAAEAVNNLSDAGSSAIAVAGFRLSSRPPDAEHPFGHGRTEYVAGLVVALLVVILGVTFLKDSVIALFNPRPVEANTLSIIILSATMLVKCWMFFFYRKMSKLLNSAVLKAAAFDSLSDCCGTLLVVASLIISRFTSFQLDAWAGIAVAGMILWAGISVLKETISKLLGESPSQDLVSKLRETLLGCPGIDGVHDIIIHNYGENSYFVTAHAEISSEGDRASAHDILEHAEVVVAKELSLHLLLHGDPHDKNTPEVIYWRSRLENYVADLDCEMKIYDFKLEKNSEGEVENLDFHLLIPHKYGDSENFIRDFLQKKMAAFQENICLTIRFVRSFV